MSWCVVNRSPPAAEILMPTRSLGETSDAHALATSDSPVTASTSRFTISRTTRGLVLYSLIESALCTAYTIEGVGKGSWPCATPHEMAQDKTRATFRISMTASIADGFYEQRRESQLPESRGHPERSRRVRRNTDDHVMGLKAWPRPESFRGCVAASTSLGMT